MMAPVDFRKVPRKSNLRNNIFLLECAAVLAVYLYALYQSPATLQIHILAFFGVAYMSRLNVMTRWVLPRELAIEEISVVTLLWLPAILASYVRNMNSEIYSSRLGLSLIVCIFGSYLNTFSELQRKRLKDIPQNKGRCYILGLFSLSRNINDFGETLLFGAWALATGAWWNGWVPVVMGASFWFFHIPDKEKYLQERYAKDWQA
jgi:steroid 5-alpha reductase family enzyme